MLLDAKTPKIDCVRTPSGPKRSLGPSGVVFWHGSSSMKSSLPFWEKSYETTRLYRTVLYRFLAWNFACR